MVQLRYFDNILFDPVAGRTHVSAMHAWVLCSLDPIFKKTFVSSRSLQVVSDDGRNGENTLILSKYSRSRTTALKMRKLCERNCRRQ